MNFAGIEQFDPVAYFRELMSVVWSDHEGGYFSIMMRGYYDESGVHEGGRITTIAGWTFGSEPKREHWRLCSEKWTEACTEKHLPMFHAKEFDHFVKVHRWTTSDYEAFIKQLTNILAKYAWFGLSASVVTSAYNDLPAWLKKKIGGRYHFCFHLLMSQLSERMDEVIAPPPFMVFERKDKVIGRTLDDFAEMDEYKLGSMVFDTKEHVPLLATADFLVYEMTRWLESKLMTRDPIRIPLLKLNDASRYHFLRYGYHDHETLSNLVKVLEADPDHQRWLGNKQWWPDSWYPNYVKPKLNQSQKTLKETLLWNQSRRPKPRKDVKR